MADVYLVDTSVFLRWFVPQVGWEHAHAVRKDFLDGKTRLETTDSARFELAHVLRTKGLIPGRLNIDQYVAAVRSVDDLDVVIHRTDADALERAAVLACQRSLRFFDALFAECAIQRELTLITADAKFCKAVNGLLFTELLRGISTS